MFSPKDKQQFKKRGSDYGNIVYQIDRFKSGFPYLHIKKAATVGDGIIRLTEQEIAESIKFYDQKVKEGVKVVKFIPASGAASRMFKSLYEALEAIEKQPHAKEALKANKAASHFLAELGKFAFSDELAAILKKNGAPDNEKNIIGYLLEPKGLNYGSLPKGLLKFHIYPTEKRTPFEEHMVEGALYAKDAEGKVRLHFTVSPEHKEAFTNLFGLVKNKYEKELQVTFDISFSQQKASTDTIAVTPENEPFRESDGTILFRPGGHGALIENLNELIADIIFIKNIDNVVPDRLKDDTVKYKKALAGYLLKVREKMYFFQKELNEKDYVALDAAFLASASGFLENTLNTNPSDSQHHMEKEHLYHYLKSKYNRPLRVCGMVKNEGEPGGGPFWAKNADETVSLQVVESVQIDPTSIEQQNIAHHATHFNPVDLVCAIKNYKGEKYNLTKFTDPATGFISKKSKDGKELKAQELPGLWNGAMSNWNTLFIEVPVSTFNPVKTVNDLLRDQHL
ncbi:MAG: NAD metabolism ATPase/kinase [Draconibacterium sp.]|nr:MAG: NAD metabolism ATPase/kinase [Draconibacterium sp.]PIF05575.1 MAG: NAD metabolism ATPase/kinase [Draconibacterium sp.]